MLTLTLPRVVAAFIESKPSSTKRSAPPPDPARSRLVSEIISINPTATAAFLDRFQTPELAEYLGHLELGIRPRGPDSRWVRAEGAPGIVVHDARG